MECFLYPRMRLLQLNSYLTPPRKVSCVAYNLIIIADRTIIAANIDNN